MRISAIKTRQRGVAIITVMLITALATAAASFIAWQQHLYARQVENLNDQAQAKALARAALDWARAILREDARENSVDHPGENWSSAIAVPAESGEVAGTIVDQQGLFNLNNLVRSGKLSEADMAVFRRLLSRLELSQELANAVADWIDPDDVTRSPGGAEDREYLALNPPYRAANRALTEIGNLYRIRGFERETIERLRRFVTVLPEPTPVNVNTAPPEVLAALFENLPLERARDLVSRRAYFKDLAGFRERLSAAQASQVNEKQFSVDSHYFVVACDAAYGRARVRYAALLKRSDDGWPVIIWLKNI